MTETEPGQNDASVKKNNVGSTFNLLGKSYAVVKKNWLGFLAVYSMSLLLLLYEAVYSSPPEPKTFDPVAWYGFMLGLDFKQFGAAAVVAIIISIIINAYLYAMTILLEVESTSGKKPSIKHLLLNASKYWIKLIAQTILLFLAIGLGLILFVVPGIFAIIRLSMAPFILVDKNKGIIESFKLSNELGKKYPWEILSAIGVTLLIIIFAAVMTIIPIIGVWIGVIIGIALSLVLVLRYQQIKMNT